MPGPLNAPAAQAVSKPPHMLEGGLLPRTPQQVAANKRLRNRRYKQAECQAEEAARLAGDFPALSPCAQTLHVTLCFDGTNNHEPSDKQATPPTTTNVARLYHASIGQDNGEAGHAAREDVYFRYYLPGVGTEFKEIGEFGPSADGLKYARGGENRVNWALTRLIDAVQRICKKQPLPREEAFEMVQKMASSDLLDYLSLGQANNGQAKRKAVMDAAMANLGEQMADRPKPILLGLDLYIYGFSRGAAEARTFVNWLAELTRQADGRYRFAGLEISVEFLGLFDTVATVGLPDLVPFADGHMSWAHGSQRLPEDPGFLRRCAHLVAAHEQRACFPLDSIRRQIRPDDPQCPSSYRAGTEEFLYPGMHSDVGGGYPPGDQGKALAGGAHVLSQVALHHMYQLAYQAGAPLQAPEMSLNAQQAKDWPWLAMDEETQHEFNIADSLVARFNAWVDQLAGGPLKEAIAHELALLTAWRIERFHHGSQAQQKYYTHCSQYDMSKEEREAFETLHQIQLAEDVARRRGEEPPVLSAEQQAQREKAQAIRRVYAKRAGGDPEAPLNTHKDFDPRLDYRQLGKAAEEFRRDYIPEWSLESDGGWSWGTLGNALLGGLIYMTNEVDEAEEYARIRESGGKALRRLFTQSGFPINEKAKPLIELFDEQVHDSRAWFMNAQLNERELWSDYFRERCIFFDARSSKRLSLLVRGEQVIGVGIALASIGLSVKRRDPRYLVGLFLPSLGIPVLRGKVGAPQVSAFDPLTGLALPMLEVAEELRAFSQDSAPALRLASALPLPEPLSAANAHGPELQAILRAHQAAGGEAGGPGQEKPGWLDQARAALGKTLPEGAPETAR